MVNKGDVNVGSVYFIRYNLSLLLSNPVRPACPLCIETHRYNVPKPNRDSLVLNLSSVNFALSYFPPRIDFIVSGLKVMIRFNFILNISHRFFFYPL